MQQNKQKQTSTHTKKNESGLRLPLECSCISNPLLSDTSLQFKGG